PGYLKSVVPAETRTQQPQTTEIYRDDCGLPDHPLSRMMKRPALFLRRVRPDERDPHHVGGARRAERHARHDDDALARLGEALAEREAAGALHHVVEIARILGDDAVHAPDE